MKVFWRNYVVVFLIAGTYSPAQAEGGKFPCGYDYLSKAEAWFKVHTEGATRSKAKTICFMEGAQLASPDSEVIKKAMLSLTVTDKNKYKESSTMLIHTAMNPTGSMDNNFDPRGDTKTYVSVALTSTGRFQIVSRYIKLPYICYRKAPQDLQLNTMCGTTDPEYKLDKRTNQCYKFHRNKLTWVSAAQSCASEGGYLAIINSKEEAEVIQEIFALNPADVIPGGYNNDEAYVGYWADDKRVWRTILGQTLPEVGYEPWYPGKPKKASKIEYCGTVARDGKLFDNTCSTYRPYICEKVIKKCDSC